MTEKVAAHQFERDLPWPGAVHLAVAGLNHLGVPDRRGRRHTAALRAAGGMLLAALIVKAITLFRSRTRAVPGSDSNTRTIEPGHEYSPAARPDLPN
jgi:hypothetical protein